MVIKISKFKIKINQRRLTYFTALSVFFLLSFYIFNLGATVFNVTKATQLEKKINSLDHQVGEMESDLIARRNNINLNLAYSLGFKETEKIKFISRKSVATVLVNTNIQ